MNAKEYLSRAIQIEREIKSQLEYLSVLRTLVTKATAAVSDMPGSPTRNTCKMEDAIMKIIEQEELIDAEIDRLVDCKKAMQLSIERVENLEYRQVLRMRYLAFKSWNEVAAVMHYNVRHVYRIHKEALKSFIPPQDVS